MRLIRRIGKNASLSGTDEKEHPTYEEDLQGYFMKRMCEYVQSKGREVIGWDELTNSTIPDGTIISMARNRDGRFESC